MCAEHGACTTHRWSHLLSKPISYPVARSPIPLLTPPNKPHQVPSISAEWRFSYVVVNSSNRTALVTAVHGCLKAYDLVKIQTLLKLPQQRYVTSTEVVVCVFK